MKIKRFEARNVKGIENVLLEEVPATLVIAGTNGCGKSSVLDCIRLLKSLHAGYEPNEANLLASEMGISRREGLRSLLRIKNRDGTIRATIELSDREWDYLVGEEGRNAVRETMWRQKFPQQDLWQMRWSGIVTPEMLQQAPEVEREVEYARERIREERRTGAITVSLEIGTNGGIKVSDSPAILVLWGTFVPGKLGVVDYHGAQRTYTRENLTQITLNEDDEETRWRSGSLYNYASKYANVKSGMAGEAIRHMLAVQKGVTLTGRSMTGEMGELVSRFLKGKEFKGIEVDASGKLSFPVRTDDGAVHDIDDLSAGEKEVVFGYLRAKAQTPTDSIIMIDEPELHLNPALMPGLSRLYQEGMGPSQGNQIWLVSHSEAFLKDAINTDGMVVYHMEKAGGGGRNQLVRVKSEQGFGPLLLDVVGTVSGLKPSGPIVITEGTSGGVDSMMIERLFPRISEEITLVAGGGKGQVEKIREILDYLAESETPPREVYAICDRDDASGLRDELTATARDRVRLWDRYHIENYLLEPEYVARAYRRVTAQPSGAGSTEKIEEQLKDVAHTLCDSFAGETIAWEIRKALRRAARVGQPDREYEQATTYAEGLCAKVREAKTTIDELTSKWSNTADVKRRIELKSAKLARTLQHNEWKAEFRGRDILNRFVKNHVPGMDGKAFRNLVLQEMVESQYQPQGMKTTLEAIVGRQAGGGECGETAK